MDNSLVMIACEIFAPIYCLFYGIKIKKDPPKMGKKGLGTKLAMQSQEAWDLAHSYGSTLCIVFGAVLTAAFVLRLIFFGTEMNITFSLIFIGVEIAFLIALMPLINLKLKKIFK